MRGMLLIKGKSGLSKRLFGKTAFLSPSENRWFDENQRKFWYCILPTKTRDFALRPRKSTKMMKIRDVTQAKWQFTKSTVLTTPSKGKRRSQCWRLQKRNQVCGVSGPNSKSAVCRRRPSPPTGLYIGLKLSSPYRATQVCHAIYFCYPRYESRDFKSVAATKTSDLCSAMRIAENHLCDTMRFPLLLWKSTAT